MLGKWAKVRVTERQLVVLEELSRSRTEAMSTIQRATIISPLKNGLEIAHSVSEGCISRKFHTTTVPRSRCGLLFQRAAKPNKLTI